MFKKPPKRPAVKVIVKPQETPNFEFVPTPDLPWDKRKLTFQNDGYNGFYVSFAIKNGDYFFAGDMQDAMSAKEIVGADDDKCPDQSAPPFDQFEAVELDEPLKTLTVHNPNSRVCKFGFSLFVTKKSDGSGPYVKLDPIGDNQNGAVHLNVKGLLAATVGAIAVGALAYAAMS